MAQNKTADMLELIAKIRTSKPLMKKRSRKVKRHHHGEEHVLKISLQQTKHRMRIIKLQPAVKVSAVIYYYILSVEKKDSTYT